MPSRNIVKADAPESYYHVYARGASKQAIFLDNQDYIFFISLFKRYLSNQPCTSKTGSPYPHYAKDMELLAFCLMPNHFHLYIYQGTMGTMSKFMKSLLTSYSRYFNTKYSRSGSLFESRYKGVRTDDDAYMQHVTRYIHLNPRYWKRYPYSSLKYYKNKEKAEWIKPDRILNIFSTYGEYVQFLDDYSTTRDELSKIKNNLADL